MGLSVANGLRSVLGLWWLTGPIFEKELLVSSRRKRNYALRSAYLFLLTVFVSYVWFVSIHLGGSSSAAFRVSRMAVAATAIVTTIAWFQFISLQLIAMVMLSNAINAEVHKKTLDVLVATPITSVQIVMGKLCSKLLQLVLLLAVSFPLLAVIRVLGGVPWDYLVAALCITLTAAVFAGAVSLFLSTVRKHAYSVIGGTAGVCLVLYGGLPAVTLLLSFLTKNPLFEAMMMPVVLAVNPFVTLSRLTTSMFMPGGGAVYSWPLHCGVMSVLSAVLVVLTVFRVRPAILARDGKSLAHRMGRRWAKIRGKKGGVEAQGAAAEMSCQIGGDPIVWRELRRPLAGSMFSDRVQGVILVAVCVVVYGVGIYFDWIMEKGFHSVYVGLLGLVILMRTAMFAATSIAAEKQSKAWCILLTTPLTDWDIVRSKALAVGQRTLPLWIALAGHIVLFTIVGVLHPVAIAGAFYSLAPAGFFLIGTGLFAGTVCKTTTGAIVATFAVPLVGWFFCPCFSFSNPVLYAAFSMQVDSGFFGEVVSDIAFTTVFGIALVVLPSLVYTGLGMFFLWWARCRVRRGIFG